MRALANLAAVTQAGRAGLRKTVELMTPDSECDAVVNIYKSFDRPKTFFPVVFRREYFCVRPACLVFIADESIDAVDARFARARFAASSEREVLKRVMRKLTTGKRTYRAPLHAPHLIELRRTLELGPYDCADGAPWYFIVNIYKDLKRRNRFFPIVFRRDPYLLKRRFNGKIADVEIDAVDSTYESEVYARPSEAAALNAILAKIRGDFEPARGGRQG
jgi:hypothetical protein